MYGNLGVVYLVFQLNSNIIYISLAKATTFLTLVKKNYW